MSEEWDSGCRERVRGPHEVESGTCAHARARARGFVRNERVVNVHHATERPLITRVLLYATMIMLKFPRFMREVKASGAGPDVMCKLHFYHGAFVCSFLLARRPV